MKKGVRFLGTGVLRLSLILLTAAGMLCLMPVCAALADGDFSSVDGIPQARDFDVRVDLDMGVPRIVTNYPFDETGATEMHVEYRRGNDDAVALDYSARKGTTTVGAYYPDIIEDPSLEDVGKGIADGSLTQGEFIYVNTSNFSEEADWTLVYSTKENQYISFTEQTHAQAYNAMGDGGVSKTVNYINGQFDVQSVLVRIFNENLNADLIIDHNQKGYISHAYIVHYSDNNRIYNYDPATGLFSGHPITDLGFTEEDLMTAPLVSDRVQAVDTVETVETVAEPEPVIVVQEAKPNYVPYTMGIIAGVAIGMSIYYAFRRWWNRRKASSGNPGEKLEDTVRDLEMNAREDAAETPADEYQPQIIQSSSGKL